MSWIIIASRLVFRCSKTDALLIMMKKPRILLSCQCLLMLLFQHSSTYVYARDGEALLNSSDANEEVVIAQTEIQAETQAELQGPSSVESMLLQDQAISEPALTARWVRELTQPYFTFKQDLHDRHNLAIGGDYNLLYQHADNSPGEDNAGWGSDPVFWSMDRYRQGHAGHGNADIQSGKSSSIFF